MAKAFPTTGTDGRQTILGFDMSTLSYSAKVEHRDQIYEIEHLHYESKKVGDLIGSKHFDYLVAFIIRTTGCVATEDCYVGREGSLKAVIVKGIRYWTTGKGVYAGKEEKPKF